jgi:hypothetical protein
MARMRESVRAKGVGGSIASWIIRTAESLVRPVLVPLWKRLPPKAQDRLRHLRG